MTTIQTLYDEFGQSPWIDNLRRDWLVDGTLASFVEQGVRGVTSNPSILAKALATSNAYDSAISKLGDMGVEQAFESLAVASVRDACDVLAGVHKSAAEEFRSGTRRYGDGFVSLEVSPRLAHDTAGTIAAVTRLHAEVGRDNVMIKIPATKEGLPAITAALGAGINVNVTLIFSIDRYDEVLSAWMSGVEAAESRGVDVGSLSSVASFFVSRVDVAVDPLLPEGSPLRGTIANAQVARAYRLFRERMADDRASALLERGAQVQRPLWASTSTKNPAYNDLLYVDTLVADETVNTMPDSTLAAELDHGRFDRSELGDADSIESASRRIDELPAGVSLQAVTDRLEIDGVAAFAASYDEVLATVSAKLQRRR